MTPDGWLLRRSPTGPAASTRASPAPCRSAPPPSSCCWSSSAARPRAGHHGSCSSTATAETSTRWPRRWRLLRDEGATRRGAPVGAQRRCPRRPYRNVCTATSFTRNVRIDERVRVTCSAGGLMPAMRRGGVAAVSEVGVLGDPTTATASEGARLFAEMVDGCAGRIERWAPGATGCCDDPARGCRTGLPSRSIVASGCSARARPCSADRRPGCCELAPPPRRCSTTAGLRCTTPSAPSWHGRCSTPPSPTPARRADRRTATSRSLFRCATTYLDYGGWCRRCGGCGWSWSTTARQSRCSRRLRGHAL